MTRDTKDGPQATHSESEKDALCYNTVTLSRFMRACYGADAAKEADRHVESYLAIKEHEIAGIWKRVVAHIRGIEIVDDQRRIVKPSKPPNVKVR